MAAADCPELSAFEGMASRAPLRPERRKAAEMLGRGTHTHGEIAKACGVTERTIRRWQREPDVKAYAVEVERATKGDAIRFLGRNALHAARRLVELSETGTPGDGTRLRATVEVLDRAGVGATSKLEVSARPVVAVLPSVRELGDSE